MPLSNWTEIDVWQYIYSENIPICSLNFAYERSVVPRDGVLFMLDDDDKALRPGEQAEHRMVRFHRFGCHPLPRAIVSDATDLDALLREVISLSNTERDGLIIDKGKAASLVKI
jgi:sulfate adenylyltransferase subunit 2